MVTQHAPVRCVLRSNTRGQLSFGGRQVRGYSASPCNDRLPFRLGAVGRGPGRRHALDLPVDTSKRLVDITIERALLVTQYLVLVQQKLDFGQSHVAVDASPRRQLVGVESGELLAQFTQVSVLLHQRVRGI